MNKQTKHEGNSFMPNRASANPDENPPDAPRFHSGQDAAFNAAPFPVALVGMGCRFPGGADNPEKFWELLVSGRDAVGEIPSERWDIRHFFDPEPGRVGKAQVREAGFLHQPVFEFDPVPFGMSAREAEGLDPQQRLLLEVAWEALEDAGHELDRLRGSATGVFMGGFCLDTKLVHYSPFNRELIDQHSAASATMTMLANRLSYVFDLRGPSLSLDTACSSSLIAVDHACRSLWSGACDMALAGGVNVMLVPEYFIALSHARMLSPLGRCTSFDERAAGYARGEGCGVVVLKPLARAVADGDPIRAVIRGTAVNHDGRTLGISQPNSGAQVALMREVYRKAGISPSRVVYVEAHGTGTRAGDKAELEALGRVMAEGRPADGHCLVGAVKSNIGHLEAASGMAGLIKTVLVLEHGQVPPNLHLRVPNPEIAWADSCLRLPDKLIPLPASPVPGEPPCAAVNSFGYGGANAHVLLHAAPPSGNPAQAARHGGAPAPLPPEESGTAWLLPVSACDADALCALAGDYARLLRSETHSLENIVYSAAVRRSHLPQRLVVVADSREVLADALTDFAIGGTGGEALWRDEAQPQKQPPVFVYGGMGPQWWGMGRELARRETVFRDALEEVDALFRAQAGWSVLAALGKNEAESRVGETRVAQPANLALQVALTLLLKHWGVMPSAVAGHSMGEVAAAWSCGALSLADAVTVALHRSEHQQAIVAGGGMLAAGMTVEGAANLLRGYPRVAIAAINAPRSLTFSGSLDDLTAIARELDGHEIFQRLLRVEIPYHSPAMDVIRAPLLAALANIRPTKSRVPWYSTVYGEPLSDPCDAHYWWKNVREPVRFQATVERMLKDGYQDFLELSPHPVLQSSLREILMRHKGSWTTATLHRKQPECRAMLSAAAALHVRGHALDWQTLAPRGQMAGLPAYPWQRRHYWKESRRSREDKQGRAGATWLWKTLAAPFPAWQVEINRNFFPWLEDHRISGRVVFPGAAYIAAALAVRQAVHGAAPCGIADVAFHEMLAVDAAHPRQLVSTFEGGTSMFRIYSHAGEEDDGAWRLHAEGYLRTGALPPVADIDLDGLRGRCSRVLDIADYYQSLSGRGLDYGPAFRRIAALRSGQGEALLEIALEDGPAPGDPLPPAVLDALFQGLFAILPGTAAMVPVALGSLRLFAPLVGRLFGHLVLRHLSDDEVLADISLMNAQGKTLATLTDTHYRSIAGGRPSLNPGWFYELAWEKQPFLSLPPQAGGEWLLLGDGALSAALEQRLTESGQHCRRAPLPADSQLSSLREAMHAACRALFERAAPETEPRILLFLDEAGGPEYDMAVRHGLLALALAQAAGPLAGEDVQREKPVLCIITRLTQQAGDGIPVRNPGGAAVWGMARVIANEMPGLVCRMVDLGADRVELEAEWLEQHLSGESIFDEVAFRGGIRYQLRLAESPEERAAVPPALEAFPPSAPLALDGRQPGSPHPFWREIASPRPGAGQIRVQVESWLLARAASPSDVTALEWHGRVQEAGEGVSGLRKGQTVWGVFPPASVEPVTTRLLVDPDTALPVNVSDHFPQAVLPFLLAWHALAVPGRLKKDETLLLHGASGAMSRVWAEVAARLGARVLAGCGDDQARAAWNALLGEASVLDASRLDYREQLQARCAGGADVAVILNEGGTAGGMVSPAALPAMPAGGRLLVVDHTLPDGVSGKLLAAGVHLLPCSLERGAFSAASLAEALEWFEKEIASGWQPGGVFPACPATQFEEMLPALREDRFALLDFKLSPDMRALPADRTYCGLSRRAAYLISGGTSGFGLALAEWLAKQGVAHLVLVSRRGKANEDDQPRLERLRSMTRITLAAVDVGNADAVSALCSGLARETHPLRGIFHCATTVSDAWLKNMDAPALEQVLRPKVAGAINLHNATQGLDLDCFVLFSSVSALVGNTGQAAYAAANACLDGIAHWRRGMGLPALSINWGAIGDVGVAVRHAVVLDHLRHAGIHGMNSSGLLSALGALMLADVPQAGVFDMDWSRWREFVPVWPARLQNMVTEKTDDSNVLDALRHDLAPLDPEARLEFLTGKLRRQLASVLRQREEQVSVSREIGQSGLDSLLTLEWVLLIHQEWGVNVSAVELLKASSLSGLADKLLPRLIS